MKKLYSNFSKADELLEGNVSIYLDLIRGISAIIVVMEHLSSRLFVGYGHLENPGILVKFLYLLNLIGTPAVIIFFVLSGLFISRSVLKAFFENKWSWRSYLINRFSRLYVVLIPALIFTFILDNIAVHYFGYRGYDSVYSHLKEFLGSLFFLQNIFVKFYGSNAPLWSLNYEFWYYILFPALIGLFFYKKGKVYKLTSLVLALIIITLIDTSMNSYFLIWLIGPLVLLLPRINFLTGRFIPLLAFLLLLIATPVHPLVMTGRLFTNKEAENLMDLFGVSLFVGIAFGFFIYALLHCKSYRIKNIEHGWVGKIAKFIASFSFSLYLIHYPIINTVYYWCAKNGFSGLQPNILSILVEVFIVILICFIAYFFSKITEAQTHIVRRFLDTKTSELFFSDRNKVLTKQNKVG